MKKEGKILSRTTSAGSGKEMKPENLLKQIKQKRIISRTNYYSSALSCYLDKQSLA